MPSLFRSRASALRHAPVLSTTDLLEVQP